MLIAVTVAWPSFMGHCIYAQCNNTCYKLVHIPTAVKVSKQANIYL